MLRNAGRNDNQQKQYTSLLCRYTIAAVKNFFKFIQAYSMVFLEDCGYFFCEKFCLEHTLFLLFYGVKVILRF